MWEAAFFGLIALVVVAVGTLGVAVLFSKKIVWISKLMKNKTEKESIEVKPEV